MTPEQKQELRERFERWIKKVLPEGRIVRLKADDPVLDGLFKVDPFNIPGYSAEPAQIVGIYEKNDPQRRLLLVANYWATLGHMWRYVGSDLGSGIEQGGVVYRLGLNYLLYGLSH